jgi:hypothetical protein
LRKPHSPGPTLVPFDHLRDDFLSRQPQNPQNKRMSCSRVIIKGLDPPIALPADLSGCPQDGGREYLPGFDRLHGPYEAMAAIAVAHPSLAPLLLGREQTLDCAELRQRMVSKQY